MDIARLKELAGLPLTESDEVKPVKKEEEKKEEQPKAAEEDEEKQKLPVVATSDVIAPAPISQPAVVPSTDSPVSTGTQPVVDEQKPDSTVTPAATEQPAQPAAPAQAMSPSEVVKLLMGMRDQIHYYHLQTEKYAEHKALNDFYDTILDIADKFIESYQGIFGRASGDVSITLKSYTEDSAVNDIKMFSTNIKTLQSQVTAHTDLVNLLDELLNACNKTIYLLTLK